MGLTLNEAVDMMRGPVGSDITLTLQREGTADPFDVKLTRETITISPVKSRLEDGVDRAAPHDLQRADLSRAREAAQGARSRPPAAWTR